MSSKKLYVVVAFNNGNIRPSMLFTTKSKLFKTMKENGFKYSKNYRCWYKNGISYEYRIYNRIEIDKFNEL